MGTKLLAKLFQFAMRGDTSAAKLYFAIIGEFGGEGFLNRTKIQNQNNFIQINDFKISQDSINFIPKDQLEKIEEVLKIYAQPQSKNFPV